MKQGLRACLLGFGLALLPVGTMAAAEPDRSEAGSRPLSAAASYIQLEPLITAVHYGRGASGLLHVELSLDVPDSRLRSRVADRMPRLRDAYNSAISSYASLAYRRGDLPDTARMTLLLQRATDAVLAETGAEVLLVMVIIHER